jgi:penicillin-binding protein-related factor A (putative recombinase)
MTPEGKAKKKLMDVLKALKADGARIKWTSMAGSQFGTDGVDTTLCFYGMYIAIEVKRFDGKGKITLRQELFLKDVEAAGGKSFVIDSAESLGVLTERLTKYHKAMKEYATELHS